MLDEFKLFDKDLRRRMLLHLDDLKHALGQFLLELNSSGYFIHAVADYYEISY